MQKYHLNIPKWREFAIACRNVINDNSYRRKTQIYTILYIDNGICYKKIKTQHLKNRNIYSKQ